MFWQTSPPDAASSLSAQHGDDLILRRMKRRHIGRDIIRFCDEARRRRPDVAFGADIIAGFPTESWSAHRQTMAMIKDAGISYLHVFPYSPRPSTPAADMPQLDGAVVKQRAGELREFGKAQLHHHLETVIGTTDRMLVESGNVGHGEILQKFDLISLCASLYVGGCENLPARSEYVVGICHFRRGRDHGWFQN